MASLDFDANNVEPKKNFEAMPPGKYLAIIKESDMKQTKKGNGQFLELKFQVIEGEYKNRTLFTRLNIVNPNSQAVKIAQGELSAICRATEIMTPKDSVELHDKPIVITIACKKRSDNGEMTNEIKGYDKKEVAVGQPQQATGNSPWARN